MKIATYNVNGVKGRLPVLVRWLGEAAPDIACLQEIKTSDETFPIAAIKEAGYGAIWHGQKGYNGVAILARGDEPEEVRRGLPGDPDDTHSRYIEARVKGLTVGCIYLPNGNPAPGPRFDYKLNWFERLIAHAATLVKSKSDVLLCGASMPFRRLSMPIGQSDGFAMPCSSPRHVRPMRDSSSRDGRMPSVISIPTTSSTPTGTTSASRSAATTASGWTTCS